MTKALKKGFTLVELIVVIAIIAILSTVSIVGYNVFVDNANRSKAEQELAQVESVLRASAISGLDAADAVDAELNVELKLVNNVLTLVFSSEVGDIAIEADQLATMNALLDLILAQVDLSNYALSIIPGLDVVYSYGDVLSLDSSIVVDFAA
ncbi:prepilin-type N-terminal cleavage/methylation domain-containing protein [Acholeplasma equirhinis]|uniref:prepilin-type N-terminal cleavage/methylation domain-containing protein n=1 Tax=Acholeplasma equirhinis TaxID=555393 RepID=UPI00197A9ADE|nr:prepilin-type N-terminal cleavage/methylation domain-containing protein [Acholeplasma equirhinis]MBN3489905.1 prepilin-type N-terminal cleavage/methylation domain-containing protein [Acholeplasma equirhinis]